VPLVELLHLLLLLQKPKANKRVRRVGAARRLGRRGAGSRRGGGGPGAGGMIGTLERMATRGG
jgi:hypothetical protein